MRARTVQAGRRAVAAVVGVLALAALSACGGDDGGGSGSGPGDGDAVGAVRTTLAPAVAPRSSFVTIGGQPVIQERTCVAGEDVVNVAGDGRRVVVAGTTLRLIDTSGAEGETTEVTRTEQASATRYEGIVQLGGAGVALLVDVPKGVEFQPCPAGVTSG